MYTQCIRTRGTGCRSRVARRRTSGSRAIVVQLSVTSTNTRSHRESHRRRRTKSRSRRRRNSVLVNENADLNTLGGQDLSKFQLK